MTKEKPIRFIFLFILLVTVFVRGLAERCKDGKTTCGTGYSCGCAEKVCLPDKNGKELIVDYLNATMTVTNRCPSQSLQVEAKGCNISRTSLATGGTNTFTCDLLANSGVSVWARRNCDSNGKKCLENIRHVTLAEFSSDSTGQTFYHINVTYSYNLPLEIIPVSGFLPLECDIARCRDFNLYKHCPDENKFKNSDGVLSDCHNGIQSNNRFTNYVRQLNAKCPDALAWARDDIRRPSPKRFMCYPGNTGFAINFCP